MIVVPEPEKASSTTSPRRVQSRMASTMRATGLAVGCDRSFVTFLAFAFREQEEVEIPAETIAQFDRAHPTEVAL